MSVSRSIIQYELRTHHPQHIRLEHNDGAVMVEDKTAQLHSTTNGYARHHRYLSVTNALFMYIDSACAQESTGAVMVCIVRVGL